MQIDGSVAVVTGGASGIGRSSVLEFARRGADVVIADVNEERLAEVEREVVALGRRALGVRCDVSQDAEVNDLAARALSEMGRVDILMNNAGVSLLGPPHKVETEDWMWILQVNLLGIVRGVNAFTPHMLERGSGYVVNTASIAGLYAYSYDAAPYIASKFGAYGYTEALAVYLGAHGIGVTVVCPALVVTNLGDNARFRGVEDPSDWLHFPERLTREAIEADAVGPMVADAIRDERFLLHTHPGEEAHIEERRRDLDKAIERQIALAPTPPKIF